MPLSFLRDSDKPENKNLDSAGDTQSKFLPFPSQQNCLIESTDEISFFVYIKKQFPINQYFF